MHIPTKDIISYLPHPALVVNKESAEIESLNKHAQELYGYSTDDIQALYLPELFTESVSVDQLIFKIDAKHNDYCLGRYKHQRKNGELFMVELFGKVLPSAESQVLMTCHELRLKREEAEDAPDERFDKVSEAANDALWDWDVGRDHLTWGRGYKKHFGHNIKKQNYSVDKWGQLIHPEDRGYVINSLKLKLKNPRAKNWMSKFRFKKSDGTYATVINKGKIIRKSSGWATRMVGAMTDVTYHEEYKQELISLNTDLKKYTRELESINKELEQFAYVASHDLQEPLRMVTSFMGQLERKYSEELDDKAQKYIYYATDGAKRMKRIIQDLLEYSKAGSIVDSVEQVDLNELINEYKVLRRKVIRERNVGITVKDLPLLSTYKTPLKQVLHCLLDNGIKYCDSDTTPKLVVEAEDKEDHFLIKVKDNGIGIPRDFHDKIFEVFKRLHNRDKYSGTGVGLSIAKKSVESLGGTINVISEKGKGSTFEFTLKKHYEEK